MSDVNDVCLMGRLGKDPEVRSLGNGGKVANLTLATSKKWKDKTSGEAKEKTEWHRITLWNENHVNLVEKYCKKGDLLDIRHGELETRKWTDKDGQDRYTTEVVLKGYTGQNNLLPNGRQGESAGGERRDSKPRDAGTGGGWGEYDNGASKGDDLDDSIPF